MILVVLSLCRTTAAPLPKNILDAMMAPTSTPVPLRIVGGQDIGDWWEEFSFGKYNWAEVIIVITWDTSCSYCRQELLYLYDIYGGIETKVKLIGLNPYNSEAEVLAYMDHNRIRLSGITMIVGDMEKPVAVPFTQVFLRDHTLLGILFGWDKNASPKLLEEIITKK